MNDDGYESWKLDRAQAQVPDGFADRVMARAGRRGAGLLAILLCATAGVAAAARAAVVLALLVLE